MTPLFLFYFFFRLKIAQSLTIGGEDVLLSNWSYETVSKDIVFKCCRIWVVAARHGWSHTASIFELTIRRRGFFIDSTELRLVINNEISYLHFQKPIHLRYLFCCSMKNWFWNYGIYLERWLGITKSTLDPFPVFRQTKIIFSDNCIAIISNTIWKSYDAIEKN